MADNWLTCDYCGKSFKDKSFFAGDKAFGKSVADLYGVSIIGDIAHAGARATGHARHFCCEKCKREYEEEHGAELAEKAAAKEEKDRIAKAASDERYAEAKRKEAEFKEHLRSIQIKSFSEDEANYQQEMSSFLFDFESCVNEDKGYKQFKIYKERLEKEMQNLKNSNPDKYQKINAQYQVSLEKCKKFYKKWAIIGGCIALAGLIVGICSIGSMENSVIGGLLIGIFAGGQLFLLQAKIY